MKANSGLTLAVIGVAIWALYKASNKRGRERAHEAKAHSDWENEGGSPPDYSTAVKTGVAAAYSL